MFDRILFPTDGGEGAAIAFDHVLDVASRHGTTVHVLNVAEPARSVPKIGEDVVDARVRAGERIVSEAAERADDRDVTAITAVRKGDPYRVIVDYADDEQVDLLAMPTHGRGTLERFLLGSTTERVVRRSNVPLLTIRPDERSPPSYPYDDVLVPTDGSDAAERAYSLAVDVAAADGAALHLLSVVALESLGADVRSTIRLRVVEDRARELVDDACRDAENAGVETASGTVEHAGSIPRAILSYVDEHDVDLVAVGTHGRTGFDRYVLGSVTDQLVRRSPIPVMTVRTPATV